MITEGKVLSLKEAKQFVAAQAVKWDKVRKYKEGLYYFLAANPQNPKYPIIRATYIADNTAKENIFIEIFAPIT